MIAGAAQRFVQVPVMPLSSRPLSPQTRWKIAAIGLLMLVGACVWLSHVAQDPRRFPVSHVDVLGTLDYADRNVLMASVQEHTDKGFYGLDIEQLRARVEQFEWVGLARVSRVWPATITVEVVEHEPAARWNNDSLISKKMKVFNPPQLRVDSPDYRQWQRVFAPLPQLSGNAGRQSELLDDYRLYEQQLSELGLRLSVLEEDDRRSQTLVINSDINSEVTVRLGYEQQELRMQRFLDIYPRLAVQHADTDWAESSPGFDMRYSNGFSLGPAKGPGVKQSKSSGGRQ